MATESNDPNSALRHAPFDEADWDVELLGRFGFRIELFDLNETSGSRHSGFLLGVCGYEAADGLDFFEWDWAEGDGVAGFGGDDPLGG